MPFKKDEKKPHEGEEVLCFTPLFCPEQYTIATFTNGYYDRAPNGDITEYVEEWIPLQTIIDFAWD